MIMTHLKHIVGALASILKIPGTGYMYLD